MSRFTKKNMRSFAWKCFVRQQLLLDLPHLETPIQSTAIYFRAHTFKTTMHHPSRCHRRVSKYRGRIFGGFLSTNRHEPFFERLTNCVGSNANKFFWQSNVNWLRMEYNSNVMGDFSTTYRKGWRHLWMTVAYLTLLIHLRISAMWLGFHRSIATDFAWAK